MSRLTCKLGNSINTTFNISSMYFDNFRQQPGKRLADRLHGEVNVMLDKRTQDIFNWLKPHDTSMNYNAAKERRQKNSGKWLLESPMYLEWIKRKNSRLWLHGKAGCGKTVLCSTVIEDIYNRCSRTGDSAVVFFYFRYDYKPPSEHENQYGQMLRSLIVQLSSQLQMSSTGLNDMYEYHLHGQRQPSNTDLALLLGKMISMLKTVFVLLDALDECDEIRGLLRFLKQFPDNPDGSYRFFVTSRKEVVIEESLTHFNQVHLEEELIANDIRAFIVEQLDDVDFKEIPSDLKFEIIKRLIRDADGMLV